jgi:hypothetical protein
MMNKQAKIQSLFNELLQQKEAARGAHMMSFIQKLQKMFTNDDLSHMVPLLKTSPSMDSLSRESFKALPKGMMKELASLRKPEVLATKMKGLRRLRRENILKRFVDEDSAVEGAIKNAPFNVMDALKNDKNYLANAKFMDYLADLAAK